jgi:orotidine-5'-phosphate decarboxylase
LYFKTIIERTSVKRGSDIVLALDFPYQDPKSRDSLLTRAEALLEEVHPYVCAVKINHHLVLPLGVFDGVQTLVRKIHDEGLVALIDCKVNDIGATNRIIAEYYYAAGFDALIANPFVGWEEGLQPVFEIAREHQRGVILLAYMSHKAASEGYGQTVTDTDTGDQIPQYVSFARKALSWNADGVVVGATYPPKIREIYHLLQQDVPIYSPGIGHQGGAADTARKAGARYLIVGREITLGKEPATIAKKIMASIKSPQ